MLQPVSDRIKLWQSTLKAAAGSPPSSIDSGNTNGQERLADFDEDSSTEDEQDVDVAPPPSVCASLIEH